MFTHPDSWKLKFPMCVVCFWIVFIVLFFLKKVQTFWEKISNFLFLNHQMRWLRKHGQGNETRTSFFLFFFFFFLIHINLPCFIVKGASDQIWPSTTNWGGSVKVLNVNFVILTCYFYDINQLLQTKLAYSQIFSRFDLRLHLWVISISYIGHYGLVYYVNNWLNNDHLAKQMIYM